MKILHINGTNAGGGLEQYLAQVFPELERRGHSNILLYGEHVDRNLFPPSTKVFHIQDIAQLKCDQVEVKIKEVLRIIEREKPDLAYIHQVLQPDLIETVTGMVPSVRFVHGFKLVCPDGRKMLKSIGRVCTFPMGFLCQLRAYRYQCMPRNPAAGLPLLRKCRRSLSLHRARSHVVVASRFMAKIMLENGMLEAKLQVIPYFTDLPTLEATAGLDSPPRILALGRITKEKGFASLLRAYQKFRDRALLTIVGDGPELVNLRELAEKTQIASRVEFPGWLQHEQLEVLYRQSVMVVVPSIWPEPFGIIGIEAMSYGKPVVAFEVGGIPDWLKHGETGYLVPPQNESRLASRIGELLDNPARAERMGMKGREVVVQNFTSDIHIDRLLELFSEVVSL